MWDWLTKVLLPQPKPTEYLIGQDRLRSLLKEWGFTNVTLWDSEYWYLTLADWYQVLSETRRNMPAYIHDRFDCDSFAIVTMARVIFNNKINTCGVAIGNAPGYGYHAWNAVLTPDGLYYFEPQTGEFWKVEGQTANYQAHLLLFA